MVVVALIAFVSFFINEVMPNKSLALVANSPSFSKAEPIFHTATVNETPNANSSNFAGLRPFKLSLILFTKFCIFV